MKTESTQMNTEENVGWFKQNYVALTTIWIKECTRFFAHMGTNPCAASYYNEFVLRDIR